MSGLTSGWKSGSDWGIVSVAGPWSNQPLPAPAPRRFMRLPNLRLPHGKDGRMTDRERLRQAIRNLHGVESTPTTLGARPRDLPGHDRVERRRGGVRAQGASEGRARLRWSHETDDGKRRYIALLGVDPAVRVKAHESIRLAPSISEPSRRAPTQGGPPQNGPRPRR